MASWRTEMVGTGSAGAPWAHASAGEMAAELLNRGWTVTGVTRSSGLWGGFVGAPSVLIARELERRYGGVCERPAGAT